MLGQSLVVIIDPRQESKVDSELKKANQNFIKFKERINKTLNFAIAPFSWLKSLFTTDDDNYYNNTHKLSALFLGLIFSPVFIICGMVTIGIGTLVLGAQLIFFPFQSIAAKIQDSFYDAEAFKGFPNNQKLSLDSIVEYKEQKNDRVSDPLANKNVEHEQDKASKTRYKKHPKQSVPTAQTTKFDSSPSLYLKKYVLETHEKEVQEQEQDKIQKTQDKNSPKQSVSTDKKAIFELSPHLYLKYGLDTMHKNQDKKHPKQSVPTAQTTKFDSSPSLYLKKYALEANEKEVQEQEQDKVQKAQDKNSSKQSVSTDKKAFFELSPHLYLKYGLGAMHKAQDKKPPKQSGSTAQTTMFHHQPYIGPGIVYAKTKIVKNGRVIEDKVFNRSSQDPGDTSKRAFKSSFRI
ncbi:Uncharacterised protein [Legionella cincinnatiensis]|uniref:Transmembrane protein n=2 Tax=Legionella cincinnatiensis TaxID=28085 RepID=A0A378IK39_9GAMM|nr:hypothetical protein Lcin_1229 [Legionella cincinnatiensis]STX35383.1 Uncharacterised protein [Legionella cincinnatiensis]